MRAHDWRDEREAVLASLYAAEIARWRDTLSWDTSGTWTVVEAGRRLGTVMGAIACDEADTAAGWCFALLDRDTMQVGGLVARSADATRLLLGTLAASPAGRVARRWVLFGWFDAPGLPEAIAARGGTAVGYVYLSRSLRGTGYDTRAAFQEPAPDGVRGWHASDLDLVPALLASAYASSEASRPFAPTGQLDEWRRYATSLVVGDGCGVFDPAVSLVAPVGRDHLRATAMVSRIAPSTAHLVQLAVGAGAQGSGLGGSLLARALARAQAAGCTEMTLLVHEHNTPARRLYERAGFSERARFLSAEWAVHQPCTSSSDALPRGGVSTRR